MALLYIFVNLFSSWQNKRTTKLSYLHLHFYLLPYAVLDDTQEKILKSYRGFGKGRTRQIPGRMPGPPCSPWSRLRITTLGIEVQSKNNKLRNEIIKILKTTKNNCKKKKVKICFGELLLKSERKHGK
jgi:hypothetical protein